MLSFSLICDTFPQRSLICVYSMAADDKNHMEGYKEEGKSLFASLSDKPVNRCHLQFIFP